MNDQNLPLLDLERSLRALAETDAHVEAPPHVETAVMRRWDSLAPFMPHPRRRRSRRGLIFAIGSAAAAVVAAMVLSRAPSESIRRAPVVARAAEPPPPVKKLPSTDGTLVAEKPSARPLRARTGRNTATPRHERGLLLVADPMLEASAASIIRVRVRRTALVTLGIGLVEPNDAGWVDLEMLVGEDGVARAIRRATPVSIRQE
jgi:hypothetical protein